MCIIGYIRIVVLTSSVVEVTRVWLTDWEWACCGDPFAVGDDVDFGIEARSPHPALAELLGRELVATVDAIESHHEGEPADRVRGRVVAVHVVTTEVVERRSVRRPGHGAPAGAVMPPDGEEWPMVGRAIGDGVFVGSRPSRYVTELVPVPDSAVPEPARGVRLPEVEGDELRPRDASPRGAIPSGDPPAERRIRSRAGWLVDVEEE